MGPQYKSRSAVLIRQLQQFSDEARNQARLLGKGSTSEQGKKTFDVGVFGDASWLFLGASASALQGQLILWLLSQWAADWNARRLLSEQIGNSPQEQSISIRKRRLRSLRSALLLWWGLSKVGRLQTAARRKVEAARKCVADIQQGAASLLAENGLLQVGDPRIHHRLDNCTFLLVAVVAWRVATALHAADAANRSTDGLSRYAARSATATTYFPAGESTRISLAGNPITSSSSKFHLVATESWMRRQQETSMLQAAFITWSSRWKSKSTRGFTPCDEWRRRADNHLGRLDYLCTSRDGVLIMMAAFGKWQEFVEDGILRTASRTQRRPDNCAVLLAVLVVWRAATAPHAADAVDVVSGGAAKNGTATTLDNFPAGECAPCTQYGPNLEITSSPKLHLAAAESWMLRQQDISTLQALFISWNSAWKTKHIRDVTSYNERQRRTDCRLIMLAALGHWQKFLEVSNRRLASITWMLGRGSTISMRTVFLPWRQYTIEAGTTRPKQIARFANCCYRGSQLSSTLSCTRAFFAKAVLVAWRFLCSGVHWSKSTVTNDAVSTSQRIALMATVFSRWLCLWQESALTLVFGSCASDEKFNVPRPVAQDHPPCNESLENVAGSEKGCDTPLEEVCGKLEGRVTFLLQNTAMALSRCRVSLRCRAALDRWKEAILESHVLRLSEGFSPQSFSRSNSRAQVVFRFAWCAWRFSLLGRSVESDLVEKGKKGFFLAIWREVVVRARCRDQISHMTLYASLCLDQAGLAWVRSENIQCLFVAVICWKNVVHESRCIARVRKWSSSAVGWMGLELSRILADMMDGSLRTTFRAWAVQHVQRRKYRNRSCQLAENAIGNGFRDVPLAVLYRWHSATLAARLAEDDRALVRATIGMSVAEAVCCFATMEVPLHVAFIRWKALQRNCLRRRKQISLANSQIRRGIPNTCLSFILLRLWRKAAKTRKIDQLAECGRALLELTVIRCILGAWQSHFGTLKKMKRLADMMHPHFLCVFSGPLQIIIRAWRAEASSTNRKVKKSVGMVHPHFLRVCSGPFQVIIRGWRAAASSTNRRRAMADSVYSIFFQDEVSTLLRRVVILAWSGIAQKAVHCKRIEQACAAVERTQREMEVTILAAEWATSQRVKTCKVSVIESLASVADGQASARAFEVWRNMVRIRRNADHAVHWRGQADICLHLAERAQHVADWFSEIQTIFNAWRNVKTLMLGQRKADEWSKKSEIVRRRAIALVLARSVACAVWLAFSLWQRLRASVTWTRTSSETTFAGGIQDQAGFWDVDLLGPACTTAAEVFSCRLFLVVWHKYTRETVLVKDLVLLQQQFVQQSIFFRQHSLNMIEWDVTRFANILVHLTFRAWQMYVLYLLNVHAQQETLRLRGRQVYMTRNAACQLIRWNRFVIVHRTLNSWQKATLYTLHGRGVRPADSYSNARDDSPQRGQARSHSIWSWASRRHQRALEIRLMIWVTGSWQRYILQTACEHVVRITERERDELLKTLCRNKAEQKSSVLSLTKIERSVNTAMLARALEF